MRWAALGWLMFAACAAGGQGVVWADEMVSALAGAGKERLVMAHFWSEGCAWCEEYENSTYKTLEFEELARLMVVVRVNGEREGATLVEKYGVRGYPTLLFLTGKGELVGRIQGFASADALRFEWEGASRRAKSLLEVPRDARAVGDRLAVAAARRDEPGVQRWMKALGSSSNARDARAEAYLAAGVFYEEELRQEDARPLFDKALIKAESPRLQAYARMGIVRTLLSVGRFKECVKHLEAALATKKLFSSHEQHARKLLTMAREKAGMPPP